MYYKLTNEELQKFHKINPNIEVISTDTGYMIAGGDDALSNFELISDILGNGPEAYDFFLKSGLNMDISLITQLFTSKEESKVSSIVKLFTKKLGSGFLSNLLDINPDPEAKTASGNSVIIVDIDESIFKTKLDDISKLSDLVGLDITNNVDSDTLEFSSNNNTLFTFNAKNNTIDALEYLNYNTKYDLASVIYCFWKIFNIDYQNEDLSIVNSMIQYSRENNVTMYYENSKVHIKKDDTVFVVNDLSSLKLLDEAGLPINNLLIDIVPGFKNK